jgi:hypothetical protein
VRGRGARNFGDISEIHLFYYYWNLSPSEFILLTDTIRGITMSGEKWDLTQPIHKYCPETDTPL